MEGTWKDESFERCVRRGVGKKIRSFIICKIKVTSSKAMTPFVIERVAFKLHITEFIIYFHPLTNKHNSKAL
jgi:hypothetical protein